ncbi:MAG: hypothetical protein IT459_22135 [Planctomycetes bacterium]|nr:hypothetical protein [Planctomycetota bacterium]
MNLVRNCSVLAMLLLASCSAFGSRNPVVVEARAVTPATDESMTLSVEGGMVFMDQQPPTRGIRFPEGTYALEGEDDDGWYFRAPAPLEFRIFTDGKMTDGRNIPGGLMLKKAWSTVPAIGYTDDGPGKKTLVWRLGGEFLRLEGTEWSTNAPR